MNRTIDAVVRYTVIATILGVLFTPLVRLESLFFPYITGKAFLFRTLVELGFVGYLGLILRDKMYLPKRTPVLYAIFAFTAVLGFATIHSINPSRSFWSNFERMEGYITILHLFVFFIVTTSVMRTKQMWHALLNLSIALSIAVGISGFLDYKDTEATGVTLRIAGLLGNSTYLGIYSLLHAFIGVFLIGSVLRGKKIAENWILPAVYAVTILFNLIVMYNTGTRGSVVGLGVAVIVGSILIAIFEKKNVLLKKSALGFLAVVVFLVSVLGLSKNTDFVKNNTLLYRFSSLITLDISSVLENQGKARSLLWGIAAEGVKERPVLGWGQDNFGYVFAKYYNPKIYDQEQWFDRTHNVFMDWLISGGVLGLLSYLSLFGAVLYMLWRKKEEGSDWSVFEKSTITALLVAYFVHNFFVFDNLTSYILFFILLAFVADQGGENEEKGNPEESLITDDGIFAVVGVVLLIAAGAVNYYTVIKPYLANKALINGIIAHQKGGESILGENATTYTGRLSYFKEALSYNTFGQQEIDEQLIELAPGVLAGTKERDAISAYLELINEQYKDLIMKSGNDPRSSYIFSIFLQKIGLYDQSILHINDAIMMSPNKQSFYYQKGVSNLLAKNLDEAATVFKKSLDLEPSNKDAKAYYAIALMYAGKVTEAKAVIGNDLDAMTNTKLLQTLDSLHMYDYLVEIAKKKIESNPKDVQSHISLAAIYLKMNQNQNAIEEIRNAIALDPKFKDQGEYYIKQIESGKNPAN